MVTEAPRNTILLGDALEVLQSLPAESVQTCVTSPPYYGLRAYGTEPQIWGGDESCFHEWGAKVRTPWANLARGPNGRKKNIIASNKTKYTGPFCLLCGAWRGELGQEPSIELYTEHLVTIFREMRRVLRKDGTFWLNLGDSYAGSWGNYAPRGIKGIQRPRTEAGARWERKAYSDTGHLQSEANVPGLKAKDLCMIPAEVAIALRKDGWWLRAEIIWEKPSAMPDSVDDRVTRSHEMLYMFAKSKRYFYDSEAIQEPAVSQHPSGNGYKRDARLSYRDENGPRGSDQQLVSTAGRNRRSVWTITPSQFPDAHFAVMPEPLVEIPLLAGSRPGDLVLDPFMGAGTVGAVCRRLGRDYLGIELQPDFVAMAEKRIQAVQQPMLLYSPRRSSRREAV